MTSTKTPRRGRKLLLATAGLATMTFSSCLTTSSGNLVAPPCDELCGCSAQSTDAGCIPYNSADGGVPDAGQGDGG